MKTQERIVAFLRGDLVQRQELSELLHTLAVSPEKQQLLAQQIELSNRLKRLAVDTAPAPSIVAKVLNQVRDHDGATGARDNFLDQLITGVGRSSYRAIVLISSAFAVFLFGFALGRISGSNPNSSDAATVGLPISSTVKATSPLSHNLEEKAPGVADVNPRAVKHEQWIASNQTNQRMESLPDVSPIASVSFASDSALTVSATNARQGQTIKPGDLLRLTWNSDIQNTGAMVEVSFDGGIQWTTIKENARGVSFEWKVPATVSNHDSAIFRVSVPKTKEYVEFPSLWKILHGHDSLAAATEITPDGKFLASVGADTRVIVWDVASGEKKYELAGHTAPITFARMSWQGTMLASCSQDSTVRVWDVINGRQIYAFNADSVLKGVTWAAAFSPDDRMLAMSNDDGSITFRDLRDGAKLRTIKPHEEAVRFLEFTADGKYLLMASTDRTASILDLRTDSIVFRATHFEDTMTEEIWRTLDRDARRQELRKRIVNGVQMTPDERIAITCGFDGTVKYWDIQTGKLIRSISHHGGKQVIEVRLSADGSKLVSLGHDGTVKIIDPYTGIENAFIELQQPSLKTYRADFSDDLSFMAVADEAGRITLWRLEKWITGTTNKAILIE